MKRLHNIMLAGTGSDVGKSVIATALCRIFLQDGFQPAPFKAQNMALNSYVTSDGLEIGRAQAVQAEACKIPCSCEMNPLLLKPTSEHTSQVVLLGRPVGNRNACEYFTSEGREHLREKVHGAFDRLKEKFNPIVLEGAGSISELNLAESDLVNMPMARYANADVILVADIDRGGVFASAYGSVKLQTPEDQRRIKGIIINKFRGDLKLFEKGKEILENICGIPVLGVIPYFNNINIEEEDSVSLEKKNLNVENTDKIKIAVVKLKHISNFTDFDCLERDDRTYLYYTDSPDEIIKADVILLPGTKSTIPDLIDIKNSGVAEAIIRAFRNGKTVWGICGGYQMMGESISDPEGIEGKNLTVAGLGLLPTSTIIKEDKLTRQVSAQFLPTKDLIEGYEIHCGETTLAARISAVNKIGDFNEGAITSNKCLGTYLHGILDNESVVNYLLNSTGSKIDQKSSQMSNSEYKDMQYDLLAEHVRKYLDIDLLYKILSND